MKVVEGGLTPLKKTTNAKTFDFEFICKLIAKADSISIEPDYESQKHTQNSDSFYLYMRRGTGDGLGGGKSLVIRSDQIPRARAEEIKQIALQRNIDAFLED